MKVLRNSLAANRGQQQHVHHHCRGHHHSHSDSRHNARRHDDDPVRAGGIHLRSCGDLNSTSVASLRRLHPPPHGSSGALYSESALWNGRDSGINHCVIRERGLRKLEERITGGKWVWDEDFVLQTGLCEATLVAVMTFLAVLTIIKDWTLHPM